MFKTSYFKGVLIVVLALIVVSILYAGWKSFDNSNRMKNPSNNLNQSTTTNNSEIDTSDWKTFRYDDGGFEMKYPPYYYAIPSTENSAWLKERPVFSLVLSEIPPGQGAKGTINPNIIIDVFKQPTATDFLTFLHHKYGNITQKEVTIGEHNALLLEWTQEVWNNKPIIDERLFIKSPKFLYVINADDFDSPLIKKILSHLKLL